MIRGAVSGVRGKPPGLCVTLVCDRAIRGRVFTAMSVAMSVGGCVYSTVSACVSPYKVQGMEYRVSRPPKRQSPHAVATGALRGGRPQVGPPFSKKGVDRCFGWFKLQR